MASDDEDDNESLTFVENGILVELKQTESTDSKPENPSAKKIQKEKPKAF